MISSRSHGVQFLGKIVGKATSTYNEQYKYIFREGGMPLKEYVLPCNNILIELSGQFDSNGEVFALFIDLNGRY